MPVILADHFWIKATIHDQAVDLDPSFTDAAFGQSFAQASETFAPDPADPTRSQRVIVRAVASTRQNGAATEQEVVHGEFNAA
jgi:hypothetical protein